MLINYAQHNKKQKLEKEENHLIKESAGWLK